MIYVELNEHSFAYDLSKNKDNWFSYDGARELYNYLTDFSDDIEFDPVALRCDYSEMEKEEIMEEYKHIIDESWEEFEDEDEKWEYLSDYLNDNTLLLPVNWDTYIIWNY